MMTEEFVEIKIKITKCIDGSESIKTLLNKSNKLSESFKDDLWADYDIGIDTLIKKTDTDGA